MPPFNFLNWKSRHKIYSRIPNNWKPFSLASWVPMGAEFPHLIVKKPVKCKITHFLLQDLNWCWKYITYSNVRIDLVLKGNLQSWFLPLLFGLFWAQIPNKVSELVSGGLVPLIITVCLLCVNFEDSKGLRKEAPLTFHPSSTCNLWTSWDLSKLKY